MAFERTSDIGTVASDLGGFVESQLAAYKRQLSIRNAADETRFNQLVLEEDLPLEAQLEYRQDQLTRVADDPEEKRRILGEISKLKDRVQQKEYSDAYLDKLIEFESGATSIDNVVDFLRERLTSTTDESIQKSIKDSLAKMEGERFTLKKNVLDAKVAFAKQDKSIEVLDSAIKDVSTARSKAVLADNADLAALYDIQLQTLNKAKAETQIERASMEFANATISGYQNATGLLDSYNAQLQGAASTGPITVGGVRYESARQFWTFKRDSYIADESGNGFFARLAAEKKIQMDTKISSNSLTNTDIASAKAEFDRLAARPELQSYGVKINTYRQDVIQHGVDLRAGQIQNRYVSDLDVNRAFRDLKHLKDLGGNVDATETQILSDAANLKEKQVGNILGTAQDLLKANPGMTPEEAIQKAAETGAGVVLSPEQAVAKTETEIAEDFAASAAAGDVETDPRTTAGAEPTKAATADAPSTTPGINDLSDRFALVGGTVYRKSDGQAFTTEEAFFNEAGVSSFQNLKFDEAFTPPTGGASPQLNQTPAPAPTQPTPEPAASQTYKVQAGDTLGAIAQRLLGDAGRFKEIAEANKLADPNKIDVDQELIIPSK